MGCDDAKINVRPVQRKATNGSEGERYSNMSPSDAIAAFAARSGGGWERTFGILDYDRRTPPDFAKVSAALPTGTLALVKDLGLDYLTPPLTKVPDLRPFWNLTAIGLSGNQITSVDVFSGLPLSNIDLAANRITDINVLSKLPLVTVNVDNNPLTSLSPLSRCTNLQLIAASGTNITHLPDLSKLSKLQSLVVAETPLTTLEGIESLPTRIDLVVTGCRKLVDISALLAGTVNRFVVDEEMLARFRLWLDAHMAEIRKVNPDFEATTFYSGE